MKPNTVNITIDWYNEQSIKAAESLKFELECNGWRLLNHFGGMRHTTMIYGE